MDTFTRQQAEQIARQLGYPGLKSAQKPIVRAVLQHHDVLAIYRTNFGKTACFAVPALLFPGTSLVISPNIALMETHVADLNDRMGHEVAACITSNQYRSTREKILDRALAGEFKLLFISPERFTNPDFLLQIKGLQIPMLVVDEAHSVLLDSTYRESYLKVGYAARHLSIQQIVAFTATCPKGFYSKFISRLLGLRTPQKFRGNLNRKNLFYSTHAFGTDSGKKASLVVTLEELYGQHLERGLIYCAGRDFTKELSDFLTTDGYNATYYHAELEPSEKRRNQNLFLSGKANIMVATKAFGQGIDIPNARFVIAYNTPGNLLELIHLWGRAGRDDDPAYCYLLHSPEDKKIQENFLEGNLENLEEFVDGSPKPVKRRIDLDALKGFLKQEHQAMLDFAVDQSFCIRRTLLKSQNRNLKNHPQNCCGNCKKTVKKLTKTIRL